MMFVPEEVAKAVRLDWTALVPAIRLGKDKAFVESLVCGVVAPMWIDETVLRGKLTVPSTSFCKTTEFVSNDKIFPLYRSPFTSSTWSANSGTDSKATDANPTRKIGVRPREFSLAILEIYPKLVERQLSAGMMSLPASACANMRKMLVDSG